MEAKCTSYKARNIDKPTQTIKQHTMLFGKKNFILMGVSAILIILGFILMSGGGSADQVSFNPDIFSAKRIQIAPWVSMAGFVLMVYAIMVSPDKKDNRK